MVTGRNAGKPAGVAETNPGRANGRKHRGAPTMRNIYQEVTDKIVAALEAGTPPWVKPWKAGRPDAAGLPFNFKSGRQYNGVNILLLWARALVNGYSSAGWMTYNQAKQAGGHVRKGEHGEQIVYWDHRLIPEKDDPEKLRRVPFLKVFTVFNLDQIEDIERPAPPERPAGLDHVDAFIKATGATINHGGDRAYYNRAGDRVQLPHAADFRSMGEYYATALHELTHWTGHESRCARQFGQRFGDEAYAAEELVAEMGAAFLCAELGIEGKLQHPAYISHWLKVLKQDNRAIFTAAKAASAAADYLRGKRTEEEQPQPLAA